MKSAARLVLVLLGLLQVGAGLFSLALGFDMVPADLYLGPSLSALAGVPVVAALGGGLLLVGLILLAMGLGSPPKEKTPDNVLQVSEFGEIRIAIVAIENMVLRVVQQTQGIKDNGQRAVNTEDGLVVQVRIKVMPDLEMPALIGELQERTKKYIEDITGIMVQEVKVMVENIILDQAPAKKSARQT